MARDRPRGFVHVDVAPLVLLAGGTTMLSWPDALCEALARGGRHAVRYDLRDSGTSTTVDPEAPGYTLWNLAADAAALERAVVNVLDNAVKFSPARGAIEVALRGGELTVRDQGPGIPADELPHVFERFWRSPSARQLPGSGLGLSIVARTVQQSGGEITLRPAADGPGTVASIRLPGAPQPPPGL
ncbi:sensor histidine kinase [Streptomyces atratus]|uniref:sensor histidine kinase n=1 Tax=Streptomyces atratus TaxID=1893 RepID=UPI003864DF99